MKIQNIAVLSISLILIVFVAGCSDNSSSTSLSTEDTTPSLALTDTEISGSILKVTVKDLSSVEGQFAVMVDFYDKNNVKVSTQTLRTPYITKGQSGAVKFFIPNDAKTFDVVAMATIIDDTSYKVHFIDERVIPTPTPEPTYIPVKTDPIIGTWLASASGTDVKVRFDANGTQSWIMHTPDKGTWEGYGTWHAQGGNSYITTELNGGHYNYTYIPEKNTIFTDDFPTFLYYPYQDDMAAASTVIESNPKPTTITTISGEKAALDKMSEMNTWMSPTVRIIGDSLTNGDYLKAGLNAVLLRNYIDQNLPEMKQLTNGAGTKKAAAQEYILYLNDVRSAADKVVLSVDKYNAGDHDGSTSLSYSGITDLNNAQVHLSRSTALL
ncbi:MAG: hypothetical protein ABFC71_03755 [Methanoregula sp.]